MPKYRVTFGRFDGPGAKAHLDQGSMTQEQYNKYWERGEVHNAVVEATNPDEALSKIDQLDGHCGVNYWSISVESASENEEVHPFYN